MEINEKNVKILNKIFEIKFTESNKSDKSIYNELGLLHKTYKTYEDYICTYCDFIDSNEIDGKLRIKEINEVGGKEFYKSGLFNYLLVDKNKAIEEEIKQVERDNKDDEIRDLTIENKPIEVVIKEVPRKRDWHDYMTLGGFYISTGFVIYFGFINFNLQEKSETYLDTIDSLESELILLHDHLISFSDTTLTKQPN